MESVTIGQISSIVLFLGAFIGGIGILLKYIKKWLKTAFKEEFDSIKGEINNVKGEVKNEINNVKNDINKIGISDCKNFLVNCFAKIENGGVLDESEKQRFDEVYDTYTIVYHQNSYIHNKYEKLKKEGKI